MKRIWITLPVDLQQYIFAFLPGHGVTPDLLKKRYQEMRIRTAILLGDLCLQLGDQFPFLRSNHYGNCADPEHVSFIFLRHWWTARVYQNQWMGSAYRPVMAKFPAKPLKKETQQIRQRYLSSEWRLEPTTQIDRFTKTRLFSLTT